VPEVTSHADGAFCFVEAGSSNMAASRRFYTALFSWDAEVKYVRGEPVYTRFLKHGRPVAGVYPLHGDADAPSHWVSYVSVSDARQSLERAIAAGAAPFGDVIEVPGSVVVAEFIDPRGALCGLWQSQSHIGSGYVAEPGASTWSELLTEDPRASAEFYQEVFDWSCETVTPTGEYWVFRDGTEARAGLRKLDSAGAEPEWRAHIGTEDVDASAALVVDLGGSVDGSVFAVPSMGRAVAVRDPVGVSFVLSEPCRRIDSD
jgi:predicted enzyme related to lactoylglutathione lyase